MTIDREFEFDNERYQWLLYSNLPKFPITEGNPDAIDFVYQIEQAWADWNGLT